ncbi:30S ribosomal protein S7 [Candidatus Adlerbacteria bacterium RIFOXYC1_FULL_48_26]|uniref:Small ribosomal subunit protein uS7 n=1 Tax=Candidatus Adlerbacteria bacterium RIFOXYC1_FULL_48_26 TaxID=1797247 RepID=A0A1F4Y3Y3_9BACT|nr:MAG: 30S ribosomal protein S7 [Candidatus Adlerbacteria bacterium RIFOXYC1_FULL_48_26]OGC93358.1 MAG: 30S ribosomal protein S7 [Candidatus Adlerbacteria bacterium RIFOXYB1_FULL_48_10]OGC96240.1 MAG: 30S ribosomal protein S7 [Candidatus Adlerbacteria bacterium RIFOXYD1_FULL_48_8]
MRRPVKNRNIVGPDMKFNSTKVEKFINSVMWDGKKSTARKVVYDAFDIIQEKTKVESPIEIFEEAIRNVGPAMEIRSRRVGGANYQVPREVRPERKQALAYRWILAAARARKGMPMANRLAEEIIAASKNEGPAIKKREDTHKMAESNKAFAHFAW